MTKLLVVIMDEVRRSSSHPQKQGGDEAVVLARLSGFVEEIDECRTKRKTDRSRRRTFMRFCAARLEVKRRMTKELA